MKNRPTVMKCRTGTQMLPVVLEALVPYFYGEYLLFFNAWRNKESLV